MKHMSIILSAFFLISSAYADDSQSYLQGVVGFDAGAVNIGFDYESRSESETAGYGGYFLFSGDSDSSLQVMSFGAMAKIHFFENRKFDLSFAPGLGISLVEVGGDDETTVGPIVKLGLLYKFSNKVAFGGEIFSAYNWLNDELPSGVEYFNFAVRIKM